MINISSTMLKDRDLDENGESYIPASQRPDGTWRKARRVKEGYVPQEEVPLYESKGKKFLNRQHVPAEPVKIGGLTGHKTIPGLFIEDKEKNKSKKKSKKVDELVNDISKMKVSEPTKQKESTKTSDNNQVTDPAKKLKNLKKRLREVEALEQKVKSGQIAKPELEQLAKIQRKTDLIVQIDELEKQFM